MKDLRTTYAELKERAKSLMQAGNLSAYVNTLREVNLIKRQLILAQLNA